MEKLKLIEARKNKGYSQEYVAEKLCLDQSNYNRREKGHVKISIDEWKKLAELLGVQIEDIFEPEENQVLIYNEHSSNNFQGNNNSTIYASVPEFMLDALQKLIKNLEEENKALKELLQQSKK
jgi:transcriptional regulator with XRE-family HTH domain